MTKLDERFLKACDLAERYGIAERDICFHETGLDADDCYHDLMEYVKGLVSRIVELEERLCFISVKDRLPEYKNPYDCFLVHDATDGSYAIAQRESPGLKSEQTWCFSNDLWNDESVTHWMPLPPVPELPEVQK